MMRLAMESRALYEELSGAGGPMQGVFLSRPTFLAAANDAEAQALTDQVAALQSAGVVSKCFEGKEVRKRVPAVASHLPMIAEVEGEGHAVGYKVVDRFLRGGDIQVLCDTAGVQLDTSSGAKRVNTSQGVIEADEVVLAAGLGSNSIMPLLGLTPRRGQLIITERKKATAVLPGHIIFASYLVEKRQSNSRAGKPEAEKPRSGALVVDPLPYDQYLIGGTREDDGDGQHTQFATVQRLLSEAVEYLPFLSDMDVIRVFAGVRAASPDGMPLVGPVPGVPGLWTATGFEGDGICLAPLIGRVMASMIAGEEISAEIGELALHRLPQYAKGGAAS